jgi:hypothetical protein
MFETHPSFPCRGSFLVGEDARPVLAEDAVDERVGARVGAGVQEQELLDAVVDLGPTLSFWKNFRQKMAVEIHSTAIYLQKSIFKMSLFAANW